MSSDDPDIDRERGDVALLWRRAGFGATPAQLDRWATAGYAAAVEELCDLGAADPAAEAVAPPVFDTEAIVAGLRSGRDDEPARRRARRAARQQTEALTLWWLQRMTAAQHPLREKLAWFWHGHFATSVQKVRLAELMYLQNETFRRLGSGDFQALAEAVVVDPAMLVWLDGTKSTGDAPNENLARELLELFLLGHGHHGHQPYGEDDVKAAARALTGWRLVPPGTAARLEPRRHDGDPKTFLGETERWGAEDIVTVAVANDASAPFVASRLCSRLARPVAIDDPLVADLASPFARDRDTAAMCRRLFDHWSFRSAATRTGLVKQPVEWLVGAHRSLGLVPEDPTLLGALGQLGQVPFLPPSVGGWPEGRAWLTTGAAQVRLQLARSLAARADLDALTAVAPAARPRAAARLLGVDGWGASSTAALTKAATDPALMMTLALVAPEHLLA